MKEKQIVKISQVTAQILDSRSDIENWFLEAYYTIKKELKQKN